MNPHLAPETPLPQVEEFDAETTETLKAHWITTAGQLVSQAAVPGGRERLADLLDLDEPALDALLSKVKARMDPEVVKELETEPPQDKGMGALRPTDELDGNQRSDIQ